MSARTFVVETYGCQMNVHDTERIAGLLLDAGYEAVSYTHLTLPTILRV